MPNPDGPEQREAERLERDTYDHDRAADRADDRREFRDLMIAICRPSCTVIGHQRHETKPWCRFCGESL